MNNKHKMREPGLKPVLNMQISIYDKINRYYIVEPISKKTAYRYLLRRLYSPLSVQQEWLKRQILNDK